MTHVRHAARSAAFAVATLVAAAAMAEPSRAPCVRVWATPIYQGIGWSHFVDVANDCEVPIDCEVATSIDPEPTYPVHVPPGEIMRVRTRYGSFTPLYDPIVLCEPTTTDTPSLQLRQ